MADRSGVSVLHPVLEKFAFGRLLVRTGARTSRGVLSLPVLALILIAAALLAPSAFGVWAAIASYEAGLSAREAGAVPDLLADARYNAAQQDLLAQTYWMQPDRSLGLKIIQQAGEVAADLAQAGRFASPGLVRPLRELGAIEENYRQAAGKAFAPPGSPATEIGRAHV